MRYLLFVSLLLGSSLIAQSGDDHWSAKMVDWLGQDQGVEESRPADSRQAGQDESLGVRRYQMSHLKVGSAVADNILSLLEGMVGESGYVERNARENVITVYTTARNHELVWKYIQVVDVEKAKEPSSEIPEEIKEAILEMSSMSDSAQRITDALAENELALNGFDDRLDSMESAGRKNLFLVVGVVLAGGVLLAFVSVAVIRRSAKKDQAESSKALVLAAEESKSHGASMIAAHESMIEASKEDLKKQVVGFVKQLDDAHRERSNELAKQFSTEIDNKLKAVEDRISALLDTAAFGDAGKQLLSQQNDIMTQLGETRDGMEELNAKHNGLSKAADELRNLYAQLEAKEDDLDRKNIEVIELKEKLNEQIREAEKANNILGSLTHILQGDDDMDKDLLAELKGGVDIVSRQIDTAEGNAEDEVSLSMIQDDEDFEDPIAFGKPVVDSEPEPELEPADEMGLEVFEEEENIENSGYRFTFVPPETKKA